MKKAFFVVFVVFVSAAGAILGYYFGFDHGFERAAQGGDAQNNRLAYDSEKFGLRFHYPEKYFLETKELGDGHRGHFQILLTEDTEENRLVREGKFPGREGPVAISIDLYQSPEELRPLGWVQGTSYSNYKLSDGTYREITLAGKPAVLYSWDGLYRADNVVVAHHDYMASMAVMYLAADDPIRVDFYEMLKTVEFY